MIATEVPISLVGSLIRSQSVWDTLFSLSVLPAEEFITYNAPLCHVATMQALLGQHRGP